MSPRSTSAPPELAPPTAGRNFARSLPTAPLIEMLRDGEITQDPFCTTVLATEAWRSSARLPEADTAGVHVESLAEIRARNFKHARALFDSVVDAYCGFLSQLVAGKSSFAQSARGEIAHVCGSLKLEASASPELRNALPQLGKVWTRALESPLASSVAVPIATWKHLLELTSHISDLRKHLATKPDSLTDERCLHCCYQLRRQLLAMTKADEFLQLGEPASSLAGNLQNALLNLIAEQARIKALTDISRICADGLIRTSIRYIPPDALGPLERARGWSSAPNFETPVADVVIIGGGPPGIAAAYHATSFGLRTVLFESSNLGKGFSDAAAEDVHSLRTNARLTSLFPPDICHPEDCNTNGMPALLKNTDLRPMAATARAAMELQTGRRFHGTFPDAQANGDDQIPAPRAEAFTHMQDVAEQACAKGALICEQAPVVKVAKTETGLWRIETAAGHVQLAKVLMVGTGFVGSESQYGREVPALRALAETEPEHFIVVNNEHALSQNCEALSEQLQITGSGQHLTKQLIVNEHQLGATEIQRLISQLPTGSEIIVVGSGESAIKGALEILALNSDISVRLFTKERLFPAQLQVPIPPRGVPWLKAAIFDEAFAAESLRHWKEDFGTPVTPDSMLDIGRALRSGRLHLYELGTRFGDGCVELKTRLAKGSASTDVRVLNAGLGEAYRANAAALRDFGLIPDDATASRAGVPEISSSVFVVAPGYDRSRAHREDPILKQLVALGSLRFRKGANGQTSSEFALGADGLSSATDPSLIPLGTVVQQSMADSAIPGMSARAFFACAMVKDELAGADRLATKRSALESLGSPPPSFSRHSYISPSPGGSQRGDTATANQLARSQFPTSRTLHELEVRRLIGETLAPEERWVLDRAHEFNARLANVSKPDLRLC